MTSHTSKGKQSQLSEFDCLHLWSAITYAISTFKAEDKWQLYSAKKNAIINDYK